MNEIQQCDIIIVIYAMNVRKKNHIINCDFLINVIVEGGIIHCGIHCK